MKQIVLVEPDFMLSDTYEKALSSEFKVYVVRDAQSALDVVDSNEIDLIITDSIIDSNNGIEILHELRSYTDWIKIPVVMLSTLPINDFPIPESAWKKYGILEFMYKPKTKPDDILRKLKLILNS